MGIHWLDGFRWMLGSEARSLVCLTRSSAAIDSAGETDASVQITFKCGSVATYVQSFSSPLARTETLVLGEKGLLLLDYRGAALYQRGLPPFPRGDGRGVPEPVERWTNPYAGPGKPESAFAGLDHLLTALETGGVPPNSGEDNLNSIALLDAAYRSAVEGRVIAFEDGGPQ
jgi:predicted dehydrogenase